MSIEQEYALARRVDLALIAPLHPGTTDRLVYDGMCGLCHNAVKFVLRHDASQSAFRFTPLQSELIDAELPPGRRREDLPDSMLVFTARGELLTKSDAALYIGQRLGGMWRLLAMLGRVVPRGVRDTLYDYVAAVRHRLFPKPEEACPIAPPHIRARFDY